MKILTAISLIVVYNFRCSQEKTIHFRDIVKDYLSCLEESLELNVTWWSLSAKGPFFEANERFKIYKIRVYENKTFDTSPKEIVEKEVEQFFPDQIFINDGPTSVNVSLRESNRIHESQSFHVMNNLKFGADIKAEGKISFFSGSVSGGYQQENMGSKTSRSKSEESLSIRQYIVNPYSEIRALSLLVKKKITKSVTHEILIEGYLVVAFSTYIKPGVSNNYASIKSTLQKNPEVWEYCGTGFPPETERRGVFALPIGVLADDIDLLEKDEDVLYYHVTEVQEIIEDKIQFQVQGKTLKGNQKKAFAKHCS